MFPSSLFLFRHVIHRDIMRPFLCGERCHRASHQNHQNRTVQHALVQQTNRFSRRSLSQYHVIPHHHGCQSCRCLCITQSENHPPLVHRHTERLLREPSRHEFSHGSHHDHHRPHFNRVPIGKERPVVDQHSHPYQKERNKDRVPHELHPVHQRRSRRNQTVQRHPRKESPDNRLQPGQFRQVSPQENHDQHEYIL